MEVMNKGTTAQLNLPPGFRFHPTDEELVVHYLARRAASKSFPIPIIAEVDLYKYDPWDLPAKALFGEKEWYFFSPRDRKYPNGARPNRAAGSGYWKATGTDKPILSQGCKAGVKKALVFYKGRAPKGVKTNWIMHEYRLAESSALAKATSIRKKGSLRLDDWVLCRIYKKSATGPAHKSIGAQFQQLGAAGGGGGAKMDADDESCLEEVLASLPDIDESRMCLPRLGSFTAMLSAESHGNNNNHEMSNNNINYNSNGTSGTATATTVNLHQLMGRSPHRPATVTAAGSESGSGRSYNDSVVDNCLLDTRYNNLPSLRHHHHHHQHHQQQQQDFFSLQQQQEVKPSIMFATGGVGYNGMHIPGQQGVHSRGTPGVGSANNNNNNNNSNRQMDSYEDEVESACKFGDSHQFVDGFNSRMRFHQQQQQQQQQQRQHGFPVGQLNGYFFQQS